MPDLPDTIHPVGDLRLLATHVKQTAKMPCPRTLLPASAMGFRVLRGTEAPERKENAMTKPRMFETPSGSQPQRKRTKRDFLGLLNELEARVRSQKRRHWRA
jgi:hypothetical protein